MRSRSIFIHICTAFSETTEQRSAQKFRVGKLFNERSLFGSPGMDLFDQKYSTNFEILLQFKIVVYFCDQI